MYKTTKELLHNLVDEYFNELADRPYNQDHVKISREELILMLVAAIAKKLECI
jgi:hypothetical protein